MKRRLRLSSYAWQRLTKKSDAAGIRINQLARFSYWMRGAAHACLIRLQHASHAEALKAAHPFPPIFLLGFWRSGTTFLHEMFCCDSRFGFPSTYSCLNPSHFLLTESRLSKSAVRATASRSMDNLKYSWSSPQEDEFALLCLGAPSPYQALLLPSLMRRPRLLLALDESSAEDQEDWKQKLIYFLRLLTAQQNKSMVLKSPTHGFRLSQLVSIFPEARFVVIERNPYEVFASNLKLWRVLIDMYSLEPGTLEVEEIEDFVLNSYLLHEEAIADGKRNIGARSCATIRYEDLVADPLGQMTRLYAELELGDLGGPNSALEQYLARVSNYLPNGLSLSSVQRSKVDEHWGELIRSKAYAWPAQYKTKESPVHFAHGRNRVTINGS